jgi:AAA family ATPase
LKKKIDRLKHNLVDEELNEISQNCHGYVGADLEILVQEAGLLCVNRLIKENNQINDSILIEDLKMALRKVKPSAMREITFDIPKVYWNQIGGQSELKKKLQQAIVWPITYAASFKRLNIKPPRGILMYGPPGCSKTMIAKALATETGLNFIAVKV